MSNDDTVHLEVDGVAVEGRKGQMLIEVTDANDAYVPRFCYHEKLSVAANCRMCLVEVERAPKPLPACATPIAEGMKVFTRSPRAIAAQKATMEFLLINHPLDCPICDQGGECELQDLAMGFGRDVSRYVEAKRVVDDENLGPLVSTDMTRCIHCTRCVRFGKEIAGVPVLGAMGRGEHMEISTYIETTIDHELSGNIIDLCPVGALNSKPFRYRARSWEMMAHALVSPHDCVGSNLWGHVHRGKLMRVVPRDNDAINETWLADRDRFSYEAVYSDDRLTAPMVRRDGEWVETDWTTALEFAAERLRATVSDGPEALGVLGSPSSTVEELYLLQALGRGLGCDNVDHRLRLGDFRDATAGAEAGPPSLGLGLDALEQCDAIAVVGGNIRRETPILAHRLRKAALAGGRIGFVNPVRFAYEFPTGAYVEAADDGLVAALARVVVVAAREAGCDVPGEVAGVCGTVDAGTIGTDDPASVLARDLIRADRSVVLTGLLTYRHADGAVLRALAQALASLTSSTLGVLSEGANSAGGWLAGALPDRAAAGVIVDTAGLNAGQMLADPRAGYLLLNIEPADCSDPVAANAALEKAHCVIALSAFDTPALRAHADVLLPVGTFAETDGTFVNAAGEWQSWTAAARSVGDSRPAWKVLRVLGTLLDIDGFDFATNDEVLEVVHAAVESAGPFAVESRPAADLAVLGGGAVDVPMYACDPLVRRARPLLETAEGHAEPVVYQ
jgi:NADH-quinone oxidoreductase subunit G